MTTRKPKTRRRGSISKTKAGTYQARVRFASDDIAGTRSGGAKNFPTKGEAGVWLAEELARLSRGEHMGKGSQQHLGAFLHEFYDKHRTATKGGELSLQTVQADVELLRLYLTRKSPGLASTPLSKLTAQMFREHFRLLSEADLSRATISRVHRVLRARLAWAVQEGLLRHNPMSDARIVFGGNKKRVKRILTPAQAQALFAVCPESRMGAYFATLLFTGARPSEVAGLQWSDVSLDARQIHIQRSLIRVKPTDDDRGDGTSWTLGSTKTGDLRLVSIPDALVQVLRMHKAAQAEAQRAAGSEYQHHNLVHCDDFGRPLYLDSLANRYLKPLLRRAAVHLVGEAPLALPPPTRSAAYRDAVAARTAQEDRAIAATNFPMISLYECRHHFGSRLASEGVSIELIAKMMGHKNIQTTLQNYVHSDEADARRALAKLEHALLPASAPNAA
jgi:integrase